MKPETPSKRKELPGAQVIRALKLVRYQDGAVGLLRSSLSTKARD